MNTSFLSRYRAFINGQRRALVIGQMLCLVIIAAVFIVSPLAAMACGRKDNNKVKAGIKVDENMTINAIVTNVNPTGSPLALNAADIPAGPNTQSIPVDTNVTLAKLEDGKWLVGTYKVDNNAKDNITFQGEIFSRTEAISKRTGKKVKVAEIWIAEIRSNDPFIVKLAKQAGLVPGTFLRNVSLESIPAA